MSASTVEVYIGLESWFKQSTNLLELLAGDFVYPWTVPERKPLSYITFPAPGEGPLKLLFNKKQNEGTVQISIWADDPYKVAVIWKVIAGLLEEVNITVLEGVIITGTCRLINILQDPNDDMLHQGVVRYEWQSWTM
jgi:hypothetical protein